MDRIQRLTSQLNAQASIAPCAGKKFAKNPDDVVIVSICRTPIGRGKKGSFKDARSTELLVPVMKEAFKRSKVVKPEMVQDVVLGAVQNDSSRRQMECRIAAQLAGMPDETGVMCVNRQCSSGLQAIANVASSIQSGFYEVGMAGGVEIMSEPPQGPFYPYNIMGVINKKVVGAERPCIANASKNLYTMGQTSENVAAKYGVTREQQDSAAVTSHKRALQAWEEGRMQEEIVPVTVFVKDPKTGKEEKKVVDRDEGMRATTSLEGLGKLKAVFKKNGTTTAGNSSQVSDGASVCLLMKRSKAEELGAPVMGVFRGYSVVGCDPSIMGVGPAVAIPEVLKRAGITVDDVDLFEVNEAFASQYTYCAKELGLNMDIVNVNGGAIALGHPLGMTGSRMTATLLYEMRRRGAKIGIVSMCIGSGQGAAGLFEVEY